MRWKKDSCRIIKRFAIFPIRIDREYRWLEIVYIEQEMWEGIWSGNIYYDDKKFVSKSEYLEYKHKQRLKE